MNSLFAVGPVVIAVSIAVGALTALILPVAVESVRDEYDRSHPVWVAERTTLVKRDGGTATIRIVGEKRRDCDLLRTWAQATYIDQPATDAIVQRPSGRTVGYINRPLGRQDLGEFIVAPIPFESAGLVVHVEHDCGGRVVVSDLGRIRFAEAP
jgi:hypothetical protein